MLWWLVRRAQAYGRSPVEIRAANLACGSPQGYVEQKKASEPSCVPTQADLFRSNSRPAVHLVVHAGRGELLDAITGAGIHLGRGLVRVRRRRHGGSCRKQLVDPGGRKTTTVRIRTKGHALPNLV